MPISRINTNSIANNTIQGADLLDASITAAKIISVANTQITGNIVSSQITSVANTQITGNIIGSQISSNTLSNTVFQTGSVENYMNATGLSFGMRNRIINGAMAIDQRNAGGIVTTDGSYPVDRFYADMAQTSKITFQQSTTVPSSFKNSVVATSLSAYSISASDFFQLTQNIEGLNVFDFGWGTADAAAITLSFWVRSSLTGTFGGSFRNSAVNRSYPFTYNISSANTWEKKSITVAGDTSGTWLTTNGVGLRLTFGLGNGSTYSGTAGSWASANYQNAIGATSLVGTNGATWYITGVQLETGSKATSFDYRPYGTELQLCQRYYQQLASGGDYSSFASGMCAGTTEAFFFNQFIVPMRSAPSVTPSTLGNFRVFVGSSAYTVTSFINRFGGAVNGNYMSVNFDTTVASGLTTGYGAMLMNSPSTTVTLAFSSEI